MRPGSLVTTAPVTCYVGRFTRVYHACDEGTMMGNAIVFGPEDVALLVNCPWSEQDGGIKVVQLLWNQCLYWTWAIELQETCTTH